MFDSNYDKLFIIDVKMAYAQTFSLVFVYLAINYCSYHRLNQERMRSFSVILPWGSFSS